MDLNLHADLHIVCTDVTGDWFTAGTTATMQSPPTLGGLSAESLMKTLTSLSQIVRFHMLLIFTPTAFGPFKSNFSWYSSFDLV